MTWLIMRCLVMFWLCNYLVFLVQRQLGCFLRCFLNSCASATSQQGHDDSTRA